MTYPQEADKGELVLAYKFNIYAAEPLSRDYVYVNAQTGKVIQRDPVIKHAQAQGRADTRYSGTRLIKTEENAGVYRLRDSSRGKGVETYNMQGAYFYGSAIDFTDNDNNWTAAEYNNSDRDNAALDAHWGALMTYDYFKNVHSRLSYDGLDTKVENYVNYSDLYGGNNNAFWNGAVLTFGYGSTRYGPFTSLDIVAHEFSHGVTQCTADLIYSYESGALNEGFSDIFGATVEKFAAPEKNPWLHGEEITIPADGHRSLADPKSKSHPDTYKGTYWYTGINDYGGVHTNSGVLNHWFYLLSIGKTGTNDTGHNYAVRGIGTDKAAAIAYRTLSTYLTPSSKYINARYFAIQAAVDLYGESSEEVTQTRAAWDAVGVYAFRS